MMPVQHRRVEIVTATNGGGSSRARDREPVTAPQPPDRTRDSFLRLVDVRQRTCLSRTTIYRRIAEGTFPEPKPISQGLVAWYASDIDAWVANPMGWKAAA